MTRPITPRTPVDPARLPAGQAKWVETFINQFIGLFNALDRDERSLYRLTWRHIAQHQVPVVAPQFTHINKPPYIIQGMIAHLNNLGLLWFDDDLRAILQCPPFSVLHTPHQVKVFGWERAYASSLLDIPATLLVYGPNVWLEAKTTCPRTGENLTFRVRLREDDSLQFELPDEFENWRIWLPLPDERSDDAFSDFHKIRSKISAFYSDQDLDTHRQYQTSGSGVVYLLDQALYLSSLLIQVYRVVSYN